MLAQSVLCIMADAQGPPSLDAAPLGYHGQRVVEALKILTTALPALIIALGLRIYLAFSCLKMIHMSMLTQDCCGIMSRRAAADRVQLLANPAIRAQILAGSIQTPHGLLKFD